ncbi:MAG TPA: universal stress protein, partial [Puia sp.]
MKKILFLCDGDNFPEGAFRFIRQIRGNESVVVKGLFFTPIDVEQMITIGFMPIEGPYAKLKEQEMLDVRKSREMFAKECEEHGIKYLVHEHEESWDRDLFIKESRFADFVVISEDLFCSDVLDLQPNYFMEEALRVSECPVLVVPEKFRDIERLAIAYDAGKESMSALKQFVNLFPDYTDLPAKFVHINNDNKEGIPDKELLHEYTSSHFDSLYASSLHFDP